MVYQFNLNIALLSFNIIFTIRVAGNCFAECRPCKQDSEITFRRASAWPCANSVMLHTSADNATPLSTTSENVSLKNTYDIVYMQGL